MLNGAVSRLKSSARPEAIIDVGDPDSWDGALTPVEADAFLEYRRLHPGGQRAYS